MVGGMHSYLCVPGAPGELCLADHGVGALLPNVTAVRASP